MAMQHLGPDFTIEQYLSEVLRDLRAYFPGSLPDEHIVHMAGSILTLDAAPPYITLRLAAVGPQSQELALCTIQATLYWRGDGGAVVAMELISWAHRRMETHLGRNVRMEPGYMTEVGIYIWPVEWDIWCPYDYELRPLEQDGFRVRTVTVELHDAADAPLGTAVFKAPGE